MPPALKNGKHNDTMHLDPITYQHTNNYFSIIIAILYILLNRDQKKADLDNVNTTKFLVKLQTIEQNRQFSES